MNGSRTERESAAVTPEIRRTLIALAERCEVATGPDRELDVAIGLTGKFYIAEPRYPGAEPMIGYVDADGSRVEPGTGAQDSLVPSYTASLDAARALVPEGCSWLREHWYEATVLPMVTLENPNDDRGWWGRNEKSFALALCAAALRARAAA